MSHRPLSVVSLATYFEFNECYLMTIMKRVETLDIRETFCNGTPSNANASPFADVLVEPTFCCPK